MLPIFPGICVSLYSLLTIYNRVMHGYPQISPAVMQFLDLEAGVDDPSSSDEEEFDFGLSFFFSFILLNSHYCR